MLKSNSFLKERKDILLFCAYGYLEKAGMIMLRLWQRSVALVFCDILLIRVYFLPKVIKYWKCHKIPIKSAVWHTVKAPFFSHSTSLANATKWFMLEAQVRKGLNLFSENTQLDLCGVCILQILFSPFLLPWEN